MADLYNHKIFNTSNIISENRLLRPHIATTEEKQCPFCIENTHLIEKVYIEEKIEDDCIRVVNNKYPVCGEGIEGLEGVHDVVIDTICHDKKPSQYHVKHWIKVFEVLQRRYLELVQQGFEFVQIFKNSGTKAGASIAHEHWQMITLKATPLTMTQHYRAIEEAIEHDECPVCQMTREEKEAYRVLEKERWAIVVPRCATVARETWIIPKWHCGTIEAWGSEDISEVAQLISKVLKAYEKIINPMDYNICLMQGNVGATNAYHCFIKILPRNGNFAGFELATGCMIHVVGAETFYKQLKQAIAE